MFWNPKRPKTSWRRAGNSRRLFWLKCLHGTDPERSSGPEKGGLDGARPAVPITCGRRADRYAFSSIDRDRCGSSPSRMYRVFSIVVVKRDCSSGKDAFFILPTEITCSSLLPRHTIAKKSLCDTTVFRLRPPPPESYAVYPTRRRTQQVVVQGWQTFRSTRTCVVQTEFDSNWFGRGDGRNIVRTPRVIFSIDTFSGDSKQGSDKVPAGTRKMNYNENPSWRVRMPEQQRWPTAVAAVSDIWIRGCKAIITFYHFTSRIQ